MNTLYIRVLLFQPSTRRATVAVSSIVANWELTVLKEKALFCQTKNPKRSRLPETLHLCEAAKEHFFFPDKNPLKLRRTSVSEVESMSRN